MAKKKLPASKSKGKIKKKSPAKAPVKAASKAVAGKAKSGKAATKLAKKSKSAASRNPSASAKLKTPSAKVALAAKALKPTQQVGRAKGKTSKPSGKDVAKKVRSAPMGEELEKKLSKEEKRSGKADKDAKTSAKKKKEGEEEFEGDDFEELEVAETYGDAIRLTAQDLEDPEEMFLTDAEGRRYCKVKDCDQLAVVEGFCRFHYLSLWKKIQTRKKILQDGKLEKYIEELTSRYPDKYLEMIKRDLKSEKDFLAAIQELEIDDSTDSEIEEDSGFIDEVRGMTGRARGGDDSGGPADDSF